MKRFALLLTVVLALIPLAVFAVPSAAQSGPELALQIGHMGEVTSFSTSPDGTILASGGRDRTVKLWDIKTGALRCSLPHDAPVLAVRFTPSGRLMTVTSQGKIRLWNPRNAVLNREIDCDAKDATAAVISHQTIQVAFGFTTGKITTFDAETGKVLLELDGHPTAVTGLAFSPVGTYLASCSAAYHEVGATEDTVARAGDVRIWDNKTGDLVKVLVGHALTVHSVAWSTDGARLATVGESGTAVIWNTRTFEKVSEVNVSEGQGFASCAIFGATERTLITGWKSGIKLWNLQGDLGHAVWETASDELPGGVEAVSTLAFLPDGRVVAGGQLGSVRFLNETDGKVLETRSRMVPLVLTRVSPDGKLVAAGGASGSVMVWDLSRGALIHAWRACARPIRGLIFLKNGNLVIGGMDGDVRVWNPNTGRQVFQLPHFNGAILALGYDPPTNTLAVSRRGKDDISDITLWTTGSWKLRATLNDLSAPALDLRFGADGTLAAASGLGSTFGQIIVWDAAGNVKWRESLDGAHGVAFSPNGRNLAVAGDWIDAEDDDNADGDVAQVWSVSADEKIGEGTAKSPGARAMSIDYSPDGQLMVTSSRDGAIRLWRKGTPDPVATLLGHTGAVSWASFLPHPLSQGQAGVVSAGFDGTIRVWDATNDKLLTTLVTLPGDDETPATPVGTTVYPDWIALTPNGYYHGSPGADRYVAWRLGISVFPVEAFAARFDSASHVSTGIMGGNFNPAPVQSHPGAPAVPAPQPDLASLVPPQVTILTPQSGDTVANQVSVALLASAAAKLSRLQLFVDGRPVYDGPVSDPGKAVQPGEKALDVAAKGLDLAAKGLDLAAKGLDMPAKGIDVAAKGLNGDPAIPAGHDMEWSFAEQAALPPADSSAIELKAVVTDANGLTGSDEIQLLRTAGGAAVTGTEGDLYVVSVGISNYAHSAYDLHYAADDAKAFAALWPVMQGRLFNQVHTTVLADADATSSGVMAAMKAVASGAQPNDEVAIFLSGHGVQKSDSEFYFATEDIDLSHVDNTAVPWSDFQAVLAGSKARRVVLFLDACHSGDALGASQASSDDMAQQLVQGGGAVVFASSLGTQCSYELDDFKHGAFTEAILEGIGQGKADLDLGNGKTGIISVEELLTFLRARVPALTQGQQVPSCPLLRDFGEPFPLAKVN